MPKDNTAWPWDPKSLIVDSRIDWPTVPVSSMETISPRIVKKLKRDDLVRLMSDPLLGFLRRAIPQDMLAGIQNTIAGKAFSLATDSSDSTDSSSTGNTGNTSNTSNTGNTSNTSNSVENVCPTTSQKSQSASSPLESSSGTSSTNSKKTALTTPEDVIRELESIARNAEAESEYGAQIAALKLIGEQMAMFQKNKPQDPNITINIVTGVVRA